MKPNNRVYLKKNETIIAKIWSPEESNRCNFPRKKYNYLKNERPETKNSNSNLTSTTEQ